MTRQQCRPPAAAGAAHRQRVLRGGAFNNNDNNVRCAARNRNNPNNDNRNNGFRVVLSTLSKAGRCPVRIARRLQGFRAAAKMAEPAPGRARE